MAWRPSWSYELEVLYALCFPLAMKASCILTLTCYYGYLRNEFNFSGVHGAMNRSGSRAK